MEQSAFMKDTPKFSGLQYDEMEPCSDMFEIRKWLSPQSHVLDLGSGNGANALFLAGNGHRVHAVDLSLDQMENLETMASEMRYPIITEVADLNDYTISDDYDLIIAYDLLHELPRDSWKQLIPMMKDRTNPGGFNLVSVNTDLVVSGDNHLQFPGMFHESELFTWYRDWPLLERKNYVSENKDAHGILTQISINKVIAQKV
jgi:cyclopropane fatty-acyl-phospholipid synthase-like methyltransferase